MSVTMDTYTVNANELQTMQAARLRTPWTSAAWITAELRDANGAKCPCPVGCSGDCTVRSHWLFDEVPGNGRTIHTLQSTSNPPAATLNAGTASAWGTVTQLNVSSYKTMDACPPLEHMECIECDTASGYYPMVYAGEFSIEGIKHTGTGLSCYYIEICKDDDSCDTSITFKDLGTLFGIYILVFVVLMLLFVLLRKVSWLEMAIDSAAWLEKGNPKFPPRDVPVPKSRKTHALSWLVDAWYRDNDWMKEFTTPDEYMLVRWFKLSSRFFFGASLLCCPLLMNLYGADSVPAEQAGSRIINSLEKTGLSKYTLLNARTESSFAAAIVMTWFVSLLLMILIRMESRKYVKMMWTVNPNKTGIKANAIVVKDMPLLTMAPVPNRLAKLGDAAAKLTGKAKTIRTQASSNLEKYLEDDDEDVGCLERLRLFVTDGTVQSYADKAKLRVLYKEESMNLLINKFERVLGKDCIAFKMLASDTRRLDAAAKKWANAREFVTQAAQAIDDLKDIEKRAQLTKREAKQLHRLTSEYDELRRAEMECFDVFINTRDEYINNQAPACSAVVVFARQMDAVIASQIQVDSVPGQWVTEPAPGNSDVVWHNLSLTSVERSRKTTQAGLIALAVSVFFMFPVNETVKAISKVKPEIVSTFGETVYNVIVSIILTVFLVIGHILSLLVSRQTGYIAVSTMDSFGASMYFGLLVLNLVLGNLSSTPLWNDVVDWMRKPHLFTYQFILRLMNTSSFFLQFIMLRTATSPMVELIHPPVLLGFVTKCLLYRSRSRNWPAFKKRLIWAQPTPTPSHRVPAQTMLVFFIGMIYAIVSPILMPVCGVFFGLFYVFWKHNIVYHYVQQYSAGTSMWSWLVGKMYFSLIFMQIITAFGLPTLGFNTMKYRAFILPLIFITSVEYSRLHGVLRAALKVPVYTANENKKLSKSTTASTSLRDKVGQSLDEESSDMSCSESDSRNLSVNTVHITNKRSSSKKMRGVVPVSEMKWSETKHVNILENTREQGRAEIEDKVKRGIWQTYAPSVLWPLAAEKSAGSIFLRCWKQIKARKQTEAAAIASVSHLPDSDQQKRDVIKDIELKKQVREKAADAVLRKSTSPYLAEIRRKRQEEEAAVVDTTKPPPSQRVSQEKRSSSSDQG